jgi:hypothetical protein
MHGAGPASRGQQRFWGSVTLKAQDQILVETERVRAVFQHAPVTLLVVVINALLTAFVLAPAVNPWSLGIWVGLMIAVSSGRWLIRRRFRGRMLNQQNRRLWIGLSVSGALMTGILWGAGASVMSPSGDTYQLFFAFVIGGMCAGTTAVNSAHLPTVLAFILRPACPWPSVSHRWIIAATYIGGDGCDFRSLAVCNQFAGASGLW